jgi:hypothetical protein
MYLQRPIPNTPTAFHNDLIDSNKKYIFNIYTNTLYIYINVLIINYTLVIGCIQIACKKKNVQIACYFLKGLFPCREPTSLFIVHSAQLKLNFDFYNFFKKKS